MSNHSPVDQLVLYDELLADADGEVARAEAKQRQAVKEADLARDKQQRLRDLIAIVRQQMGVQSDGPETQNETEAAGDNGDEDGDEDENNDEDDDGYEEEDEDDGEEATVPPQIGATMVLTVRRRGQFSHRNDVRDSYPDGASLPPQKFSEHLSSLFRAGKLARIIYNNSRTKVYYGDPSWLVRKGNKISVGSRDYLPSGPNAEGLKQGVLEYNGPRNILNEAP